MREPNLHESLDAIEKAILPTLSTLLDGLLDSAALAQPGRDAEAQAAELRRLAGELDGLNRALETLIVPFAQPGGRAAA